jgi:hypothetical protein
MTTDPLVSDDFTVPRELITQDFRLEPLGPQHNAADHEAWTSSIGHIRATPGFAGRSWPPVEGMSLAANLADLERHAAEFAGREAFTYTVLDPESEEVIGCLYLKPPRREGSDVDVLSWVRADRAALDVVLYQMVLTWLRSTWPFARISYAPR